MATPEEIKKELRELDRELAGLADRLQNQRRDGLTVAADELDKFRQVRKELRKQVDLGTQAGIIDNDRAASYQKTLAAARQFSTAQRGLNKQFKNNVGLAQKLQLTVGGLTAEFDKFMDRLPGGKSLTRLFGVNDLKENLQDAVDDSLNALGESLAAGDTKATAMAKSMGKFLSTLNFSKLAMSGLIALFAAAVGSALALENQFRTIAKETGVVVSQAEQLIKSSLQIAGHEDHRLSTMGDILKVQKATIKEFGTMAMITPEIAAEVAGIGEAFGYGAEQAAAVNNALLGLGVPAANAADAQRELAAEALKAGVNVGTVTADIATNAKATAKYFNGNVKSLTKAAVEAAKMGVSLATMVKVSDSLLDIESSLANQFEFMALTGKEVNFDLARQLALQGDIAGATKLILDQMGGINEFNQMDVLQKEAAAKAAGMSVDDLSKSLAIQDKLGNATEEQLAAAMGLGLSAAEIADMSDKELQNRLEQEQTAARLGKESSQFANELKMILLPLGRDLLKIFEAVIPVIKIIASTVGTIISPLLYIIESFTKVLGLLTGSNEQLTTMEKIVGSLVGGLLLYKGVMKGIAAFKALGLLFTKKENAETKKGLAARMLEFGIEKGKAILAGISAAFKSVGWMPVVGVALATAAVGALVALVSSKASPAGDMFSPADGRTQISTKEGGLFQLSKNDDVMAAPGLSGAMAGGGTATSGGSTDMSTTNALLNQLVSNISALSNRPVQIKIGDRVVDEIKAQVDINSTYVVG